MLHDFGQDYHDPRGELFGTIGPVQFYRCKVCSHEVALPDCRKVMCLLFMSFGCSGKKPKWQAPMKARVPYEEKKDYPAKAQKRRKE